MRALRRCLREPLVQFLVLGAALFGVHRWAAPPALGNAIVVPAAVVRSLRAGHLRRAGTAPTAAEEAALIQRYVDAEILYREAVAMGLDRGDVIVRRRLVQKMEFLTESLEAAPAPSEAELEAYLDAHRDRYSVPPRVTLMHVFASTEQQGEHVAEAAAAMRERLEAGADPSREGDPFARGRVFSLHSEAELAAAFGPEFANRVMALPVGTWSEPIRSSYGLHVVRIAERRSRHRPSLAGVRSAVLGDWREERRAAANRVALERLRRRYQVRVEPEDAGPAAKVAAAR